jgi:hypothetical protein
MLSELQLQLLQPLDGSINLCLHIATSPLLSRLIKAAATETTEGAGKALHLLRLAILQVCLQRAHNVALLLDSCLTSVDGFLKLGRGSNCSHLACS